MNRNKGYVWLVVILVIGVVLAIIWSRGGPSNTTDPLVSDTNKVSNIEPAGEVKAEPVVTKPVATKQVTTPKAPSSTSLPSMTATGEYYIRYYSTGFSPARITVPLGKSVHFVNLGQAAMKITPVDNVNTPYASFKQSKSVGNGGVFNYTFTQRGVYSYYNSNNKSHVGIITVQ